MHKQGPAPGEERGHFMEKREGEKWGQNSWMMNAPGLAGSSSMVK